MPPSEERVAILGASSLDGLGAGFLQQYLETGRRQIVIVGRRLQALEEVRHAALEKTQGKRHPDAQVHIFVADCTKPRDVLELRGFIDMRMHGLDTLQIVFGVTSILPLLGLANADPCGVNADDQKMTALQADAIGLDAIAQTVQQSSDSNLKGTALVLGALIPMLQTTSKDPVVVATGSIAGLLPAPTRSVYCATKAAQHFLVDSVALECQTQAGTPVPGTDKKRALVRFLLIAPGPIQNTFVAKYAVDSVAGPRDNRSKALEVHDVVRTTLNKVDSVGSGLLVMPQYLFAAHLLSKFNVTKGITERIAHKMYRY
ncbi:hypothetical protein MVES1_003851 [Malassezia vespertilionis]|uniref:Uncharacterized protein n=1 Tax=Malassezia vespertilionis TaxID=2020962 RepID=A0A2N1J7S5_9BASI|nr:uncharacterized protein MVES1_003851 [Malassezia vespertilionis]PKI82615.1 hypothetical protein MVES_003408 [Malassezia vespertilionis]WFD08475.1 hypothetical protein MVES1_003851 [Malassezia vespertilionis]